MENVKNQNQRDRHENTGNFLITQINHDSSNTFSALTAKYKSTIAPENSNINTKNSLVKNNPANKPAVRFEQTAENTRSLGLVTSTNGLIDIKFSTFNNDVQWVKIASIEYAGQEQVYDIEVEGTHNFVGNGIVAHNTYVKRPSTPTNKPPTFWSRLGEKIPLLSQAVSLASNANLFLLSNPILGPAFTPFAPAFLTAWSQNILHSLTATTAFLPFAMGTTQSSKNWAYNMVEADSLAQAGFDGRGIHVVVIDPNIRKNTPRFGLLGLPRVISYEHGTIIANTIQTLLPNAKVELIHSGYTVGQLPYEMLSAINRGANVINLSMGFSQIYSDTRRQQLFSRLVDQAVRGKIDINFEKDLELYNAAQKEASEVVLRISQIKHVLDVAERLGVTIVAASGYSYHSVYETFAQYPNVIMVGGVDQDYTTFEAPKDARIDIYAPGADLQTPIYGEYSNSFAAPFVTVAAAVATSVYHDDLNQIKRVLFSSTKRDNYNLNVINYRLLVNNLQSFSTTLNTVFFPPFLLLSPSFWQNEIRIIRQFTDPLFENITNWLHSQQKTTKKSAYADLVDSASSLKDWPDNLRDRLIQINGFVKRIVGSLNVDLPGVEPGELGLSGQPNEPVRPTSNSLLQNLIANVNILAFNVNQYLFNYPIIGPAMVPFAPPILTAFSQYILHSLTAALPYLNGLMIGATKKTPPTLRQLWPRAINQTKALNDLHELGKTLDRLKIQLFGYPEGNIKQFITDMNDVIIVPPNKTQNIVFSTLSYEKNHLGPNDQFAGMFVYEGIPRGATSLPDGNYERSFTDLIAIKYILLPDELVETARNTFPDFAGKIMSYAELNMLLQRDVSSKEVTQKEPETIVQDKNTVSEPKAPLTEEPILKTPVNISEPLLHQPGVNVPKNVEPQEILNKKAKQFRASSLKKPVQISATRFLGKGAENINLLTVDGNVLRVFGNTYTSYLFYKYIDSIALIAYLQSLDPDYKRFFPEIKQLGEITPADYHRLANLQNSGKTKTQTSITLYPHGTDVKNYIAATVQYLDEKIYTAPFLVLYKTSGGFSDLSRLIGGSSEPLEIKIDRIEDDARQQLRFLLLLSRLVKQIKSYGFSSNSDIKSGVFWVEHSPDSTQPIGMKMVDLDNLRSRLSRDAVPDVNIFFGTGVTVLSDLNFLKLKSEILTRLKELKIDSPPFGTLLDLDLKIKYSHLPIGVLKMLGIEQKPIEAEGIESLATQALERLEQENAPANQISWQQYLDRLIVMNGKYNQYMQTQVTDSLSGQPDNPRKIINYGVFFAQWKPNTKENTEIASSVSLGQYRNKTLPLLRQAGYPEELIWYFTTGLSLGSTYSKEIDYKQMTDNLLLVLSYDKLGLASQGNFNELIKFTEFLIEQEKQGKIAGVPQFFHNIATKDLAKTNQALVPVEKPKLPAPQPKFERLPISSIMEKILKYFREKTSEIKQVIEKTTTPLLLPSGKTETPLLLPSGQTKTSEENLAHSPAPEAKKPLDYQKPTNLPEVNDSNSTHTKGGENGTTLNSVFFPPLLLLSPSFWQQEIRIIRQIFQHKTTKKSASADLVGSFGWLLGWLDTLKINLTHLSEFVNTKWLAWTRRESNPVSLGYQANPANLPGPRQESLLQNLITNVNTQSTRFSDSTLYSGFPLAMFFSPVAANVASLLISVPLATLAVRRLVIPPIRYFFGVKNYLSNALFGSIMSFVTPGRRHYYDQDSQKDIEFWDRMQLAANNIDDALWKYIYLGPFNLISYFRNPRTSAVSLSADFTNPTTNTTQNNFSFMAGQLPQIVSSQIPLLYFVELFTPDGLTEEIKTDLIRNFTTQYTNSFINSNDVISLIKDSSGKIVSVGFFKKWSMPKIGQGFMLNNIMTLPGYENRGYASAIIADMQNRTNAIFLDNQRMKDYYSDDPGLYEKLGFYLSGKFGLLSPNLFIWERSKVPQIGDIWSYQGKNITILNYEDPENVQVNSPEVIETIPLANFVKFKDQTKARKLSQNPSTSYVKSGSYPGGGENRTTLNSVFFPPFLLLSPTFWTNEIRIIRQFTDPLFSKVWSYLELSNNSLNTRPSNTVEQQNPSQSYELPTDQQLAQKGITAYSKMLSSLPLDLRQIMEQYIAYTSNNVSLLTVYTGITPEMNSDVSWVSLMNQLSPENRNLLFNAIQQDPNYIVFPTNPSNEPETTYYSVVNAEAVSRVIQSKHAQSFFLGIDKNNVKLNLKENLKKIYDDTAVDSQTEVGLLSGFPPNSVFKMSTRTHLISLFNSLRDTLSVKIGTQNFDWVNSQLSTPALINDQDREKIVQLLNQTDEFENQQINVMTQGRKASSLLGVFTIFDDNDSNWVKTLEKIHTDALSTNQSSNSTLWTRVKLYTKILFNQFSTFGIVDPFTRARLITSDILSKVPAFPKIVEQVENNLKTTADFTIDLSSDSSLPPLSQYRDLIQDLLGQLFPGYQFVLSRVNGHIDVLHLHGIPAIERALNQKLANNSPHEGLNTSGQIGGFAFHSQEIVHIESAEPGIDKGLIPIDGYIRKLLDYDIKNPPNGYSYTKKEIEQIYTLYQILFDSGLKLIRSDFLPKLRLYFINQRIKTFPYPSAEERWVNYKNGYFQNEQEIKDAIAEEALAKTLENQWKQITSHTQTIWQQYYVNRKVNFVWPDDIRKILSAETKLNNAETISTGDINNLTYWEVYYLVARAKAAEINAIISQSQQPSYVIEPKSKFVYDVISRWFSDAFSKVGSYFDRPKATLTTQPSFRLPDTVSNKENLAKSISDVINRVNRYYTEVLGVRASALPDVNKFIFLDSEGFKELASQSNLSVDADEIGGLYNFIENKVYIRINTSKTFYFSYSPEIATSHEHAHAVSFRKVILLPNGHHIYINGVHQIETDENDNLISGKNYWLDEAVVALTENKARLYTKPDEQAPFYKPIVTEPMEKILSLVDPLDLTLREAFLHGNLKPLQIAVDNNEGLHELFSEILTHNPGYQNSVFDYIVAAYEMYEPNHTASLDYLNDRLNFYLASHPTSQSMTGMEKFLYGYDHAQFIISATRPSLSSFLQPHVLGAGFSLEYNLLINLVVNLRRFFSRSQFNNQSNQVFLFSPPPEYIQQITQQLEQINNVASKLPFEPFSLQQLLPYTDNSELLSLRQKIQPSDIEFGMMESALNSFIHLLENVQRGENIEDEVLRFNNQYKTAVGYDLSEKIQIALRTDLTNISRIITNKYTVLFSTLRQDVKSLFGNTFAVTDRPFDNYIFFQTINPQTLPQNATVIEIGSGENQILARNLARVRPDVKTYSVDPTILFPSADIFYGNLVPAKFRISYSVESKELDRVGLAQERLRRIKTLYPNTVGQVAPWLRFPDNFADHIVDQYGPILHLEENYLPQYLAEVYRVLKPGGEARLLPLDFHLHHINDQEYNLIPFKFLRNWFLRWRLSNYLKQSGIPANEIDFYEVIEWHVDSQTGTRNPRYFLGMTIKKSAVKYWQPYNLESDSQRISQLKIGREIPGNQDEYVTVAHFPASEETRQKILNEGFWGITGRDSFFFWETDSYKFYSSEFQTPGVEPVLFRVQKRFLGSANPIVSTILYQGRATGQPKGLAVYNAALSSLNPTQYKSKIEQKWNGKTMQEWGFPPSFLPKENIISKHIATRLVVDVDKNLEDTQKYANQNINKALSLNFLKELRKIIGRNLPNDNPNLRSDIVIVSNQLKTNAFLAIKVWFWVRKANDFADQEYKTAEEKYLWISKISAEFSDIHPFEDGNGRVGFIITNLLLTRLGLPNFAVPFELQGNPIYEEYFSAMDKAVSSKNYAPLIEIYKKYAVRSAFNSQNSITRELTADELEQAAQNAVSAQNQQDQSSCSSCSIFLRTIFSALKSAFDNYRQGNKQQAQEILQTTWQYINQHHGIAAINAILRVKKNELAFAVAKFEWYLYRAQTADNDLSAKLYFEQAITYAQTVRTEIKKLQSQFGNAPPSQITLNSFTSALPGLISLNKLVGNEIDQINIQLQIINQNLTTQTQHISQAKNDRLFLVNSLVIQISNFISQLQILNVANFPNILDAFGYRSGILTYDLIDNTFLSITSGIINFVLPNSYYLAIQEISGIHSSITDYVLAVSTDLMTISIPLRLVDYWQLNLLFTPIFKAVFNYYGIYLFNLFSPQPSITSQPQSKTASEYTGNNLDYPAYGSPETIRGWARGINNSYDDCYEASFNFEKLDGKTLEQTLIEMINKKAILENPQDRIINIFDPGAGVGNFGRDLLRFWENPNQEINQNLPKDVINSYQRLANIARYAKEKGVGIKYTGLTAQENNQAKFQKLWQFNTTDKNISGELIAYSFTDEQTTEDFFRQQGLSGIDISIDRYFTLYLNDGVYFEFVNSLIVNLSKDAVVLLSTIISRPNNNQIITDIVKRQTNLNIISSKSNTYVLIKGTGLLNHRAAENRPSSYLGTFSPIAIIRETARMAGNAFGGENTGVGRWFLAINTALIRFENSNVVEKWLSQSFNATKKSASADLVGSFGWLLGWLDTLKINLPRLYTNVNILIARIFPTSQPQSDDTSEKKVTQLLPSQLPVIPYKIASLSREEYINFILTDTHLPLMFFSDRNGGNYRLTDPTDPKFKVVVSFDNLPDFVKNLKNLKEVEHYLVYLLGDVINFYQKIDPAFDPAFIRVGIGTNHRSAYLVTTNGQIDFTQAALNDLVDNIGSVRAAVIHEYMHVYLSSITEKAEKFMYEEEYQLTAEFLTTTEYRKGYFNSIHKNETPSDIHDKAFQKVKPVLEKIAVELFSAKPDEISTFDGLWNFYHHLKENDHINILRFLLPFAAQGIDVDKIPISITEWEKFPKANSALGPRLDQRGSTSTSKTTLLSSTGESGQFVPGILLNLLPKAWVARFESWLQNNRVLNALADAISRLREENNTTSEAVLPNGERVVIGNKMMGVSGLYVQNVIQARENSDYITLYHGVTGTVSEKNALATIKNLLESGLFEVSNNYENLTDNPNIALGWAGHFVLEFRVPINLVKKASLRYQASQELTDLASAYLLNPSLPLTNYLTNIYTNVEIVALNNGEHLSIKRVVKNDLGQKIPEIKNTGNPVTRWFARNAAQRSMILIINKYFSQHTSSIGSFSVYTIRTDLKRYINAGLTDEEKILLAHELGSGLNNAVKKASEGERKVNSSDVFEEYEATLIGFIRRVFSKPNTISTPSTSVDKSKSTGESGQFVPGILLTLLPKEWVARFESWLQNNRVLNGLADTISRLRGGNSTRITTPPLSQVVDRMLNGAFAQFQLVNQLEQLTSGNNGSNSLEKSALRKNVPSYRVIPSAVIKLTGTINTDITNLGRKSGLLNSWESAINANNLVPLSTFSQNDPDSIVRAIVVTPQGNLEKLNLRYIWLLDNQVIAWDPQITLIDSLPSEIRVIPLQNFYLVISEPKFYALPKYIIESLNFNINDNPWLNIRTSATLRSTIGALLSRLAAYMGWTDQTLHIIKLPGQSPFGQDVERFLRKFNLGTLIRVIHTNMIRLTWNAIPNIKVPPSQANTQAELEQELINYEKDLRKQGYADEYIHKTITETIKESKLDPVEKIFEWPIVPAGKVLREKGINTTNNSASKYSWPTTSITFDNETITTKNREILKSYGAIVREDGKLFLSINASDKFPWQIRQEYIKIVNKLDYQTQVKNSRPTPGVEQTVTTAPPNTMPEQAFPKPTTLPEIQTFWWSNFFTKLSAFWQENYVEPWNNSPVQKSFVVSQIIYWPIAFIDALFTSFLIPYQEYFKEGNPLIVPFITLLGPIGPFAGMSIPLGLQILTVNFKQFIIMSTTKILTRIYNSDDLSFNRKLENNTSETITWVLTITWRAAIATQFLIGSIPNVLYYHIVNYIESPHTIYVVNSQLIFTPPYYSFSHILNWFVFNVPVYMSDWILFHPIIYIMRLGIPQVVIIFLASSALLPPYPSYFHQIGNTIQNKIKDLFYNPKLFGAFSFASFLNRFILFYPVFPAASPAMLTAFLHPNLLWPFTALGILQPISFNRQFSLPDNFANVQVKKDKIIVNSEKKFTSIVNGQEQKFKVKVSGVIYKPDTFIREPEFIDNNPDNNTPNSIIISIFDENGIRIAYRVGVFENPNDKKWFNMLGGDLSEIYLFSGFVSTKSFYLNNGIGASLMNNGYEITAEIISRAKKSGLFSKRSRFFGLFLLGGDFGNNYVKNNNFIQVDPVSYIKEISP